MPDLMDFPGAIVFAFQFLLIPMMIDQLFMSVWMFVSLRGNFYKRKLYSPLK